MKYMNGVLILLISAFTPFGTGTDGYETGNSGKVVQYDWDAYPTYPAFVDIMEKFGSDYPDMCKIVEIGKTVRNRKLLFAVISGNINVEKPKPRVMYSSSMHGDETTGYITLLRLTDYLLSHYDSTEQVKKIVDSVETWICPLANPDGTYHGGDSTVMGARRYNANGVDLNRNFPSPGQNIGNQQLETLAMMRLADSIPFVMGINFHSGAEFLIPPYDAFLNPRYSPDYTWFIYVCRNFLNLVHEQNSRYMTGGNNGIIDPLNSFTVFGTRMDYMNWFQHCREITAEISFRKLENAQDLPKYWQYLHNALLYYIGQSLRGIRGVVTDSSGTPLKAKVFIENHDKDSSFVYSSLPFGDYYRPIYEGTYTAIYSCEGCQSATIDNIQVENNKATVVNVKLNCNTANKILRSSTENQISIIPTSTGIKIWHKYTGARSVTIFNLKGEMITIVPTPKKGDNFFTWEGKDYWGNSVSNGCYLVKIETNNALYSKAFILSR